MSAFNELGGILGWGDLPDPDEIAIQIGQNRILGWQSVSIMRSAEAIPNQFILTAADIFPFDNRMVAVPDGREQAKVFIGGDLVVTGWVDRVETVTGPNQHEVTITGRGLCEDLVDCSVDLRKSSKIKNGYANAKDIVELATIICDAFKIEVRLACKDRGPPIPGFQIANGETPYEVLERVARYVGFLIYEDEKGTLVLDRVGKEEMASGFGMPGNIESAASIFSIDQRYSDITVVASAIAQYSDINPLSGLRDHQEDPEVPRNRPLVIVSEQTMPGMDYAKQRALWEIARRKGRSQAIRLTCDSWRDAAGRLWQPNMLAMIDAIPHKLVGLQWIIGSVTFRKDQSGTHADLVLMPPDAFSVQPGLLNLYDPQITAGSPIGASDAKPPSTMDVPGNTRPFGPS